MYMSETVGIAELRQNLSKHLARVTAGERLVVTDRNRPVATLGPPPGAESALERLVAEGRLTRPVVAPGDFAPVALRGARENVGSRHLAELRDDDR